VSESCDLSPHSITRTRKSQEDRHKTSQSRIKSRRECVRIITISTRNTHNLDETHKHIIRISTRGTYIQIHTSLACHRDMCYNLNTNSTNSCTTTTISTIHTHSHQNMVRLMRTWTRIMPETHKIIRIWHTDITHNYSIT